MLNTTKRKLWDIFIGTLIVSLIGLVGWGIDRIYENKRSIAVVQADVASIKETTAQDVKELKEDVNEIKKELKVQNRINQEDKDKWFQILLDIKKATKENNKP